MTLQSNKKFTKINFYMLIASLRWGGDEFLI